MLFCDFLSLKTDVNVHSKSNKQKTFFGIMKATDENSRIRIRKSVVRIRGFGSVPKSHGSTKLAILNSVYKSRT
jgi:hypothetical protein